MLYGAYNPGMATSPIEAASLQRQACATATRTAAGLWSGVPWFCWAYALSVTCAVVGLHLDISWHRSIGRDSFWNPAHMVLYSSGVLAAIASGYLIVRGTLTKGGAGDLDLRSHSVEVWGLHAPLGAFVAAWGGLGILYDAVFDNWWHNAYGLDVRFTSPPHLLFSLSLWFEMLGGLLLVVSWMNRAERQTSGGYNRRLLEAIVLYLGALMATAQLFACFSYTWDTKLHNARAYIAVAIFLPVLLAMMSSLTRQRWAATIIATIYTALLIGLILVLPLFAATPRLGPIFIPVTHFIPPRFPLLILVPCFALDCLWRARDRMGRAVCALLGGVTFIATLVMVEWPFANFLLSEASANRFFGTRYLGFDDLTAPPDASLWQFQAQQGGLHLMIGLAFAALIAAIMLYLGRIAGERLRLIRR